MTHLQWSKTKPEFTEECMLIVVNRYKDEVEYNIYTVEKNQDATFYLWRDGIHYEDWGNLSADLYFTMPLIEK